MKLSDKRKNKIHADVFKSYCIEKDEFYDPRGNGNHFICKNCYKPLTLGKMPRQCICNGLYVEEIPDDLVDLTGLENQLIAPYLLFMKIRKVPKSGIELMQDRVVLVPVEPCDIMNTIEKTLLPRSMAESSVVAVDFKRMKDLKNTHQSGCIRPVKMSKAIAFLRDIGNPYFQNIIIKCMFCQKHFENTDDHVFVNVGECYLNIK